MKGVADAGQTVVAGALDGRVGERPLRGPRLLDEAAATDGVRLVERGEVAVDGGRRVEGELLGHGEPPVRRGGPSPPDVLEPRGVGHPRAMTSEVMRGRAGPRAAPR